MVYSNKLFKPVMLFLVLVFGFNAGLKAQKFKYSLPGLDTLEESFIVSGGSSTVLNSGNAEIISNQTMISYWLAFHETNQNSPIIDRLRRSQFISDWFAYYGISQTGKWDIGIHLRYLRSRLDNAATSSMFKVFESENANDGLDPFIDENSILDKSYGGLGSVGLRFRWKPISRRPEFVVNGGYAIATIKDETEQIQLGVDRDVADIGFTYYKSLNSNTYYFFGTTLQAYLPSAVRDETLYNTSFNFFLVQRTTNKRFTFYPGLSYNLSFKPSKLESNPSLIKVSDFLLAYGGIQYAPNQNYNFFFTGGFPLVISDTNPQLEIVRQSYSALSLGFRIGL